MITVTFDWITATTKLPEAGYSSPVDAVLQLLRPLGLFVEYEQIAPGSFYRHAVRCSRTGGAVYWDNVSSALSASLVLPGSVCAGIGDDNVGKIVTKLQEAGFVATRLDVATTFTGEAAAKKAFDALPSVLVLQTKPKKTSVLKDNRGYVTCTVGSRTSSYYLRAYDAPKAQYAGNPDSFRVELEIKGEAAAKLFRQHSPEGIKAIAVRKAASMLQPYSLALASLLLQLAETSLTQPPVLGRHSGLDPEDWYRKQVIPALLKLKRLHFAKFMEVRRMLIDTLDIS